MLGSLCKPQACQIVAGILGRLTGRAARSGRLKPAAPVQGCGLKEDAMTEKTDRWSQDVTEHSDALDLEDDVFTLDDPAEIAASLKRSAEHSRRKKGTPFQSAMSMLTFYINRAGDNLSKGRRETLEAAKDELRKAFGRETD
jgi:hypothetical protein